MAGLRTSLNHFSFPHPGKDPKVPIFTHPYPSDPAQQKTLDRISQYISPLRIAGDLAEEALRHADAELLTEAKERVKKA